MIQIRCRQCGRIQAMAPPAAGQPVRCEACGVLLEPLLGGERPLAGPAGRSAAPPAAGDAPMAPFRHGDVPMPRREAGPSPAAERPMDAPKASSARASSPPLPGAPLPPAAAMHPPPPPGGAPPAGEPRRQGGPPGEYGRDLGLGQPAAPPLPPGAPPVAPPERGRQPPPAQPPPAQPPTRRPEAGPLVSADLPADATSNHSLVPLLLIATGAVLAAGVVLVLVIVILRSRSAAPPGEGPAPRILTADADAQGVDARTHSVVLGDARVRVLAAEWDVVRGRNARNETINSGARQLSIFLEIRNVGTRPVPYESWYTGDYRAELTDDQGRTYQIIEFREMTRIDRHTPFADIFPGNEVVDRVVFALPGHVNRDTIRRFRLTLAAQAVGSSGTFRFDVPVEMIHGF